MRNYTDLLSYDTFEDRLRYLHLGNGVAHETFGGSRYLNQSFYSSNEWLDVRSEVLVRDNGRDLGIEGLEIRYSPIVHHMTSITKEDILNREQWILDPEYLITVSNRTHNAIHYSIESNTPPVVAERSPGDTNLWGGGR